MATAAQRHRQNLDFGRGAPVAGSPARCDAIVRMTSTGLCAASLGLVSYWWIAAGGITDLSGWASGLTSVGRISGLVASLLLLVQVLLLARLPLVERAFGQGRLVVLHRWVGFSSVNLLALHIVTITWGYEGGSLPSFPRQFWNLVTTYPGVLLATVGSALLVLVASTSVKVARRKLRYESWHLLHLYAYLGVGLALPHQLWTGQQFVSSTGRTVFWWSAWAMTVGAVVVWRIGMPVLLNLRHRLEVASVVDEGDGIWSVIVTGRKLARLRVEAGQFFNWRFLAGRGWSRAHPYSLSASPDGTALRITVQEVGDGSSVVPSLAPGTRVLVEGPFGRLTSRPRTRLRLAFIGAGVGITPLRALAQSMDYEPGSAVYIERFAQSPLFAAETDELALDRGLRVIRVGGKRRATGSWIGDGAAALETDLAALQAWIPDVTERDTYVCGPMPWCGLVIATLRQAGVPNGQIHLETFGW